MANKRNARGCGGVNMTLLMFAVSFVVSNKVNLLVFPMSCVGQLCALAAFKTDTCVDGNVVVGT